MDSTRARAAYLAIAVLFLTAILVVTYRLNQSGWGTGPLDASGTPDAAVLTLGG